ncbi:DUF1624 domain-containing protein [Tabrizicola sp. J26]|uniref:heparan-alpha-glucosaminide N-acetyltransferase n=1 Tax=Alitabrizicola rongguiensis TaxID=2909234 RepID=UPI001F1E5C1C|nr:heparan-alpha-glucosaminide N-acetyltransferase [Tabrizicola rongguiensis]MCF1708768.1 DUF1624 domain-containing protein [Tabrizicola rongguiensis]
MPASLRPRRIALVDLARSAALLGMAIFHFTFDLELFGHLPPGTTAWPGFWAVFARVVAGSFIFLAGVSLYLAHGGGIRWRDFLLRLARIVGAAALVSLATYMALPEQYVFFGILHAIAAFSVLGLLFIRLPPLLLVAVAGLIYAGRTLFTAPLFAEPWLVWTGLSPFPPLTMDFEPLFPWFGTFLLGIALASAAARTGLADRLRAWPARPGKWTYRLSWPGRHSLVIYLVHQPILLALVGGLTWAFG